MGQLYEENGLFEKAVASYRRYQGLLLFVFLRMFSLFPSFNIDT